MQNFFCVEKLYVNYAEKFFLIIYCGKLLKLNKEINVINSLNYSNNVIEKKYIGHK